MSSKFDKCKHKGPCDLDCDYCFSNPNYKPWR